MYPRNAVSVLLASALLTVPAVRASADAGDAVAGAIVGGIIGHAIGSNQAKKKTYVQRKTYAPAAPTISSAQRAENRSVQHALNYFGFNAGGADGVLGRNSRAAISAYQAHLGYPATGQLTQYEKDFLLTSHNRALAGGPATNQMIAANPMGTRGLLLTYRDQAAGTTMVGTVPAMPAPMTTTVVVAPQVPPVAQPAPGPAAAPEPQMAAAPAEAGPKMPTFLGTASERSLASHCNAINLMTNANGGFTTLDTMADPQVALNEQFCLARTYAIAQSEKLASQVQGTTAAEITDQCKQLAPLLKEQVAAISVNDKDTVTQQVSSFILGTGMPPSQVAQTARICLGDGYRIDDMDVALASALILVVLGEPVYSELLGHHLTQGFGTSRRSDLAYAWYQTSSDAIARGATQVFAPAQPGRAELILTAASEVSGAPAAADEGTPVPASAPGLPTFQLAQ